MMSAVLTKLKEVFQVEFALALSQRARDVEWRLVFVLRAPARKAGEGGLKGNVLAAFFVAFTVP